MTGILPYLIGGAMVATLGVLVFGLVGTVRRTADRGERSNKLMQYRVLFQFVALALFAFLMYLARP